MEEEKVSLKGLLRGIEKNFLIMLKKGNEIHKVDSPRKAYPKISKEAERRNKIAYQVISSTDPVQFERLRDAKSFAELLAIAHHDSDIIRIETTTEGYIVDERKIK